MQCLECNHIPEAGETDDPSRCPKCHVFYHKGLSRKLRQTESALQDSEEALRGYQDAGQEGAGEEKRPVVGYRVKEALSEYQGATPVVVLDLKMSFFSMIWFMVKWALASIPALIILVFIGTIFFGLVVGLVPRP